MYGGLQEMVFSGKAKFFILHPGANDLCSN